MSYNHQKSTAGLWLNSIISAAFIRIAKGLPIKELTNKHFSSLYLLLVQQASDATRPAGCSMGGSVTYCYCTVMVVFFMKNLVRQPFNRYKKVSPHGGHIYSLS